METSDAIKTFLALNRTRIARLSELFPTQQRPFIELLPLIFHTNSPALPGFISNAVPAGISAFRPKDAALDAAQKFNRSFAFKRRTLRRYPILGLYLINDLGGISYANKAEFELWLVHRNQLSEEDKLLLQQKMVAIQSWAQNLNIQLHIRLFNKDSLGQQSISNYDLDRFYLNGLVLAGRLPLWWAISPEQESDYQQSVLQLSERHHPSRNNFIDFGPLPTEVKAQPLFHQAYQQLNHMMDCGLISCLNLIYLNHCLDVYPNINWLCHSFKKAIYQNERNPLQLDSNILKLEALAKTHDISAELLELAKQSLYVLFNERLSQDIAIAPYPWRREFCKQLTTTWQWSEQEIERLDHQSQSHYRQCLAEFEQIRSLLFDKSHAVFSFAKQQKLVVKSQLKQLQHKQYLYDTVPDVINRLPTTFLPSSAEEHLYLSRTTHEQGWTISDFPADNMRNAPLYHGESLLQVLTWAINNQVLIKSTRLKIADQTQQVAINTVMQLVQHLLSSAIARTPEIITDHALSNPAKLQKIMLFVNLEQSPTDNLSQQGLVLSSLQSDPLNYALKKQSLVLTVEALIYSSWGQWHYLTHQKIDSPLQMLASIIQWQPENITAGALSCWCPSETHGQAIHKRILSLYSDVITHYLLHSTSGNYHLNIANQHYRILWQAGRCNINIFSKQKILIETLATANIQFSVSKFDYSLAGSALLNHLLRQQSPEQISLFLQFHNEVITIYLLDELGNIIKQQFDGLTESTLITHFYHFLRPIKLKNSVNRLRFYRLEKANTTWEINAIPIQAPSKQSYLPVTIEMESTKNDALCKIRCGSDYFEGAANDKSTFDNVRNLVLKLRQAHQHYPLYITELTFSQESELASNQYVLQKQRLEQLLNQD
jgi:adenylate cyclase, class 1